jgi:dipeptide transport system ATP-binding protein
MPLLEIEDLHVEFPTQGGVMHAVEGLSLSVEQGEVLGIVGESGSGKSVAMLALMGLIAAPGRVRARTLRFAGQDLLGLPAAQRRRLVGKDMAMVFQDPSTSLNPCFTIGWQLVEALRLHLPLDRAGARRRAIDLLEQVGIPAAASRLDDYPHQLSGGMNQRVMIAMAISCNPRLLIADEPTTALDVTIQAQILDLLRRLQAETGMTLVLITHNMGVVHEMAERVAVMYAGQVMEQQPVSALFARPQHPYTEALLAALPEHGAFGQKLATIQGVVPGVFDRPPGCLFAPRCAYATQHSRAVRPDLRAWQDGSVRCHYPLGDPQRQAAIDRDGAVGAEASA